ISSSAHFGRDSSPCDWTSFVLLLDTCVLDLGMAILIMMYHYCFLKNFADKDNYTQLIILLDEGRKIGRLNKKIKNGIICLSYKFNIYSNGPLRYNILISF